MTEPIFTPTPASALAERFHETYERLAPSFGYETRPESRTAWADVPAANKALMISVCEELLSEAQGAVAAMADADPPHEIGCPSCGATIRARMADSDVDHEVEARGLLSLYNSVDDSDATNAEYLAEAQVHATLQVAAVLSDILGVLPRGA